MKFFSRLLSDSAIRISGGRAWSVKGRQTRRLLGEVLSLCDECEIGEAEIWIDASGRVTFSKEIRSELHQRFLNVISANG